MTQYSRELGPARCFVPHYVTALSPAIHGLQASTQLSATRAASPGIYTSTNKHIHTDIHTSLEHKHCLLERGYRQRQSRGRGTMPNWRDEYLSNITKAQSEHHVDRDLIAACQYLVQPLVCSMILSLATRINHAVPHQTRSSSTASQLWKPRTPPCNKSHNHPHGRQAQGTNHPLHSPQTTHPQTPNPSSPASARTWPKPSARRANYKSGSRRPRTSSPDYAARPRPTARPSAPSRPSAAPSRASCATATTSCARRRSSSPTCRTSWPCSTWSSPSPSARGGAPRTRPRCSSTAG